MFDHVNLCFTKRMFLSSQELKNSPHGVSSCIAKAKRPFKVIIMGKKGAYVMRSFDIHLRTKIRR